MRKSVVKLNRSFFQRDTLLVARELLGKILCRRKGDLVYRGRIVETEGYLGLKDKAAHTYSGRITERTAPLWGEAGHAYIYLTYGIHHLCNLVTEREGVPNGVLLRGVEPLDGISEMGQNRFHKSETELSKRDRINLTNGPGKMTRAMDITYDMSGTDVTGNILWLEDDGYIPGDITETVRVGIDYSEEAIEYPYRFYITGNPWVSRK